MGYKNQGRFRQTVHFLRRQAVIELYGDRWNIETTFKRCVRRQFRGWNEQTVLWMTHRSKSRQTKNSATCRARMAWPAATSRDILGAAKNLTRTSGF